MIEWMRLPSEISGFSAAESVWKLCRNLRLLKVSVKFQHRNFQGLLGFHSLSCPGIIIFSPTETYWNLEVFCIVSTSIYNWDTYWLQRAWHLSTFSLCRSGRCTTTGAVCGPTAVTNRPWGTSPSTTQAQSSSAVAMTGTSSSGTLRQVRKFQKYLLSDCLS